MDEQLLTSYRNKCVSSDIVERILQIQSLLKVNSVSTGKAFSSFWRIGIPPFSGSCRLTKFLCYCNEDGCIRLIRNVGKYLLDDRE